MADSGKDYSGSESNGMAGTLPSAREYRGWENRQSSIATGAPQLRSVPAGNRPLAIAAMRPIPPGHDSAARTPATETLPFLDRESAAVDVLIAPRLPLSVNPDAGEDAMDRAMRHLREHFRENVAVKSLAGLARLSLRQFHRNFKKRFGMPPNQYLIRMRVLAARDMLLAENRPISKIAYDLGFADDTLFIRHFKARMGMTPLQYRKAKR